MPLSTQKTPATTNEERTAAEEVDVGVAGGALPPFPSKIDK